jgi:hypothetical protein
MSEYINATKEMQYCDDLDHARKVALFDRIVDSTQDDIEGRKAALKIYSSIENNEIEVGKALAERDTELGRLLIRQSVSIE